jgi:hypothetical protein
MDEHALLALRTELGGAAPGLSVLDDAELEAIAVAVYTARRRQSAALAKAGEDALRHVPKMLRGPIRRILG